MKENDMLMVFLNLQAQLKLLHWQTTSYAEHKAFEEAYNSLDPLIDQFIECYQGLMNERISLDNGTMEILDIETIDLPAFIISIKKFLVNDIEELASDSSLANIVDEMLAVINKLQYLLTLN